MVERLAHEAREMLEGRSWSSPYWRMQALRSVEAIESLGPEGAYEAETWLIVLALIVNRDSAERAWSSPPAA